MVTCRMTVWSSQISSLSVMTNDQKHIPCRKSPLRSSMCLWSPRANKETKPLQVHRKLILV